MLDHVVGLVPPHCSVGVSLRRMGPGRHSLRVAARKATESLSSNASATALVTPRRLSKVSEAKLRQLRSLKSESESEVEDLPSSSEDKPASEEFNLRVSQPSRLAIKRQLNFSCLPKATTMNDRPWEQSNSGKRKTRVKVKLEPEDDIVKGSRPSGRSKPELSTVKIEPVEQGRVERNANWIGTLKQEPKEEEIVISPGGQNTEIDDVVRAEPREDAGRRRRKVQSNVLSRVTKFKVEDCKEEQESRQVPNRRKRKLVEQSSTEVTSTKQVSSRIKSSPDPNAAVPSLELISVRPASGTRLASETSLAITSLPGPFPSYARPFPEECQQVKDLLSALHGHLPEYERHKVSCPTIEQHIYVQPLESLDLAGQGTKIRSHGPATKSLPRKVDKTINTQLALTPVSSEQGARPKDMVQTAHPRDRRAVLDSLIGTLLSQNTTDNNSRKAFASLRKSFPTWEEVFRADPKAVEDAIRCGGLAEIKAERIRTILGTLLKERGEISMEYIRSMSNEDIKAELSRFKGVGPKTIACVLMFHLQRNEFPVDTHVFRISKMLGWVPEQADREKSYLHLNQRIPDSLKFDIHCLFVTHGKRCPKCAKRFNRVPSDGECPLLNWKSRWSSSRRSLELEFPSS